MVEKIPVACSGSVLVREPLELWHYSAIRTSRNVTRSVFSVYFETVPPITVLAMPILGTGVAATRVYFSPDVGTVTNYHD